MGLDPSVHEQNLMAQALERRAQALTPAELRAEILVSGGFLLTVAILLALFPPAHELWEPGPAAACLFALVVALRVEFDTGSGWTVPSQLAFVPLLFTMPPSLVPAAVVVALLIAKLPDVARGELRPIRLLRLPSNAWFAIGVLQPC